MNMFILSKLQYDKLHVWDFDRNSLVRVFLYFAEYEKPLACFLFLFCLTCLDARVLFLSSGNLWYQNYDVCTKKLNLSNGKKQGYYGYYGYYIGDYIYYPLTLGL